MRYQDDINTEHNILSIGRAAVAQWTKRMDKREFKTAKAQIFFYHTCKYNRLSIVRY